MSADETEAAHDRVLRAPAVSMMEPRTIAATRVAPARPRRAAPIDVDLVKAEMGFAFRLLADAGRFNLVMQEGLTGQVSATMHRVDPYDALLLLAQANGAEVRYDRAVVVVTKR